MRVLLTWLLDFSPASSEAVNPAGSGVNLPLFQLPQNYHPTPVNNQKSGELFPKLKIPMQLRWESRWSFLKPGCYTWAHRAKTDFRLGLVLTPPPRHIPTSSCWPPLPLQPPRPGHWSHRGMTGPVGPGRDLFGVIRPQALGLLRWLALKTNAASSSWRDPKIGLGRPQGDQLLGMELGTPQVADSRD